MPNLVAAAVALTAALVAGPALADEAAGGAKGKPALATVRGVVKAASATALAVETGPGGKDLRFVLDERTVVMGMKPLARIAATDLRKGDPVTVSYADEGGRAVARRVWRRPPAPGAGVGAEKGKPTASR
jgi:hypothetical protein